MSEARTRSGSLRLVSGESQQLGMDGPVAIDAVAGGQVGLAGPGGPGCPGDPGGSRFRNLLIVVRADPIICGHSTEARNLAEAARAAGFARVHIVSYPIETLRASGLPLKPLESVQSYSEGIFVDRPEPIGDYKVVDGRLGYAISGHLMDLVSDCEGPTAIMDLYLVPHGQMVINAVDALRRSGIRKEVATIGEAVGSDITNVVSSALKSGQFGAAALVLSNYLAHDVPVAVSRYTRELIIDAGRAVDERMGTRFAPALGSRVQISYPAIDTGAYLDAGSNDRRLEAVLSRRGLKRDGFVLFLSRLSRAKGVDDLIHAYRASELYGTKRLVICGNGPEGDRLHQLADGDAHIDILHDVTDDEKPLLMHACHTYALPSKPRPEFTETFGIAVAEKMLAGGLGAVITTRTGGLPEATGGHCLEHDPGCIRGLREQLDRVAKMTEHERRELAERARLYAQQFDRANVLDKLVAMASERAVA